MLFWGSILDPAAVEQLGWTLVHSLWQGLVIGVALAITLARLRKRSARSRYLASVAALLVWAASPVLTFLYLSSALPDLPTLVLPFTDTGEPVAQPRGLYQRLRLVLQPLLPWLLTGWFAGVAWLTVERCLLRLHLSRLIGRDAVPLRDGYEQWPELARGVGICRRVQFYEVRGNELDTPATFGWLRPVVLVPTSVLTGVSYEYLSLLVLHELAHVRRHDYLVELVMGAVLALLFFHPATWFIRRWLTIEREACCDDLVAQWTEEPEAYAQAILSLVVQRMPLLGKMVDELDAPAEHEDAEEDEAATVDSPVPAGVAGVAGDATLKQADDRSAEATRDGSLGDRVLRLTDPTHRRQPPVVSLIVASAFVALACAQLVLATLSAPRSLRDVRSLSGRVYEIVGVAPGGDGDLLAALNGCIAAGVGDAAALDALVSAALSDPRADRLTNEVFQAAASPATADVARPPWTHGSPVERVRVLLSLRQRACSLPRGSVEQRRAARVALLLAAQESGMFGVGPLGGLLKDDQLIAATGLSVAELRRLRGHLRDHMRLSRAAGRLRQEADEVLEAAAPGTVPTELSQVLRALAQLGVLRPDVQWRLTGVAVRALEVAGKTSAEAVRLRQELAVALPDPRFQQLLSAQLASGTNYRVKRITMAELEKLMLRAGRPPSGLRAAAPSAPRR